MHEMCSAYFRNDDVRCYCHACEYKPVGGVLSMSEIYYTRVDGGGCKLREPMATDAPKFSYEWDPPVSTLSGVLT